MASKIQVVSGNLLLQDVDVIVNAWNRNIIPWRLLLLQGVARAIRREAGSAPFQELARAGPIPLGGAVLTGAGNLGFRGIIHVAGINMLWRSSERSIRDSVTNALGLARERRFESIAFPLIGASTGGGGEAAVIALIEDQVRAADFDGRVVIVRYAAG